jgi:hypothetical protein
MSMSIGRRIKKTMLISRVAYNHAKPFAFHGDDPGRFGRKFLQHPLSNLDDSRFVVSVELQAGRGKQVFKKGYMCVDQTECLWRPFDINPPPDGPDMDQQIITVRNRIQGLSDYWVEYYRMSQRCDMS